MNDQPDPVGPIGDEFGVAQYKAGSPELAKRLKEIEQSRIEFERGAIRPPEPQPDLPMLSDTAAATYEMLLSLPPYRGMKATEILKALDNRGLEIGEANFRARIIPELKPYGVENAKRLGYYIPASKRPR